MTELKHDVWPIDKVIQYARNPRKNDDGVAMMAAAIKEYGFKVPLIVRTSGDLVDGHLRLKAAKKLGLKEVPVILADDLTEAQVKAFRLSVNRMAELAEWDEELLSLEFEDLKASEFDLEKTGFDVEKELAALQPKTEYTRKIEVPIYEIKGEKPPLSELYDTTKRDELVAKINESNVDEEIKTFLRFAAERHVVFNFAQIAEFYAHQQAEVQELMEQSALVIIDFEKAIEAGFIKMTEKLLSLAGIDGEQDGEE